MLDVIAVEVDDCCRRIRKADLAALDSWECPRCGLMWRPTVDGKIRCWEPVLEYYCIPAPSAG